MREKYHIVEAHLRELVSVSRVACRRGRTLQGIPVSIESLTGWTHTVFRLDRGTALEIDNLGCSKDEGRLSVSCVWFCSQKVHSAGTGSSHPRVPGRVAARPARG